MHECGWTERRLAWVTEINVATEIVIKFLRQAQRQFVEEIVRMLSIMQRLIVPRFAALKEKRITATALGKRIKTHHQTRADLRGLAKRMRIHCHNPVRRIDPIIATSRADVCVTREDCAVQHQHVVAEHEHAAVHRRRIGEPRCAGAFSTHWIREVDGRVHFHVHLMAGVGGPVLVHLMRLMIGR